MIDNNMKYRVGRKQKRVILDKNGHEVAICHKGNEELAQQICDLLNKHGLVSIHNVSNRYSIEDIERCVENWGLCKVEKEYIERFLNVC